jgi:hypothetical protein
MKGVKKLYTFNILCKTGSFVYYKSNRLGIIEIHYLVITMEQIVAVHSL